MEELAEVNRWLHDFSAAIWLVGAIMLWLLAREAGREAPACPHLCRVVASLPYVTLPALVVALATGALRAASYARYEHAGPVTGPLVAVLVAKHVFYAALVAWGVWVHVAARSRCRPDVRSGAKGPGGN